MNRRRALAALFALALQACRSDTEHAVDPVWGKQACEHCAMLVSEHASAAELVTRDGDRKFFDDIGCMAMWIKEHGEPAKAWVRAPDDSGWVDARTAKYRTDAKTPMDYGFVPSAGEGISWDEVRSRAAARGTKKGP